MEVAHFLVKNLGSGVGRKKFEVFMRFSLTVDEFGLELARAAADELYRYSQLGIGGRGITLLASMRWRGLDRTMTHDESLKKVPGPKAIDPVKSTH